MTIVLVSIILAGVRITGHKGQSYQAVAHLWVGWLIGLWTLQRGALEGWTVIALSVVEVGCFVYFRFIKTSD